MNGNNVSATAQLMDKLVLMQVGVLSSLVIFNVFYRHQNFDYFNYFVLLAAIFSSVRFALMLVGINLRQIPSSVFLTILFLGCIAVSLSFQVLLGFDEFDQLGRSSLQYSVAMYGMGFLWLIIGVSIQSVRLGKANFVAAAIVVLLIWIIGRSLESGSYVVSYYSLMSESGVEGLSHLSVGDFAVLLLIIAFSVSDERYRIIIYLSGLLVLFALGGRTALYVYALTGMIYGLFFSGLWRHYIVVLLLGGASIAFQGIAKTLLNDNELASRMFLIGGLKDDTSFQGRMEYFLKATDGLLIQAPFGDAGFIVREFGSVGMYMHNILSFWQFYGFIPFILLLAILIKYILFSIKLRKELISRIDVFGVYLLIYSFICVMSSRALGFYLLWLAIGFWCARLSALGRRSSNLLDGRYI